MKTCLIVSGGEYNAIDVIYKRLVSRCDFVIACDKGLEYAQKMNIKVDLALGDFDSFFGDRVDGGINSGATKGESADGMEIDGVCKTSGVSNGEAFSDNLEGEATGECEVGGAISGGEKDGATGDEIKGCKMRIVRLPVEKDDTDTLFAIKAALRRGFKNIVILCALGKRLDHELANIQGAIYAVKNGARVEIASADEHLYFFSNGKLALKKRAGFSLSVFSLSDKCEGVYERGTKYPLENAVLENSFPIGVSNEWAEDEAEISVGEGVLLVVESRLR